MQPLASNTTSTYSTAFRLLDEGLLDEAGLIFSNLNFQELTPELELSARVEAIQLAILQERYADALEHAEAALQIAEHEPLIHHLAGRARWEQGDQWTAAESFVYAAELLEGLHDEKPPAQYNADASQVFFMAAEACRAFMQHAEAMSYYERAHQYALQ